MTNLVLVTGATGFVGSNLCADLVKRGYKVRALVRNKKKLYMLEGVDTEIAWGSLEQPESLEAACKGVDYIINVAALASDWGKYKDFYIPNVKGVEYLLNFSLKENIKRFVHISSIAIHGFGNHIDTTEDGPFFPTKFPYCVTKMESEKLLFDYYKRHKLPVTAIRPGNIFGEKDTLTFAPIAAALEKRQLPYVDGGKWLTCPVSVYNLNDAIIAAMENDKAIGESFIITDGLKITWKEWSRKLCGGLCVIESPHSYPGWFARFLGASMEGIYKLFRAKCPPPLTRYRTQQVSSNYHFSIEKAKRLLGWYPRVDIDDAIMRTVEWYREHVKAIE
jgi:nucleoside-diphosphate-sugar epimerase